ncbi:MAG: hypothetical protein ACE3JP_05980, partial [Ectobacillus sp.]
MKITYETLLILHPTEIRKDKKHFIVEDTVTGEFFEMPAICVDAIERIGQGDRLDIIEAELKKKYPNEEVDILDFANQLIELGLVQSVDGEKMEVFAKNSEPGFQWLSPKLGRLFFNRFTAAGYAILFPANILLLVWNKDLFPHYKDIFVFDVMALNVLMWMALTFILVLIHEFGHVLAIRAHDLPARLEVGHRLFFVVFETDMTAAWKLPASKRNMLYLAGPSFDMLMLFLALAAQLLFPQSPALLQGIMGIVVLDVMLRVLYQCCVYMKTDFYFVLENVSGNYNLAENGKQYIKSWLSFGRKTALDGIFKGEERMARWYGIFYLMGVVVTVSLFFLYYIPQLLYICKKIPSGLIKPITSAGFWDALIIMLQICLMVGLLLYSWIKDYKRALKG